jgi:hypothetical protein
VAFIFNIYISPPGSTFVSFFLRLRFSRIWLCIHIYIYTSCAAKAGATRDPPRARVVHGPAAEAAQRDVHDAMGEASAVPLHSATPLEFCEHGPACIVRVLFVGLLFGQFPGRGY